jgi:hypothetical protein
VIMGFCSSHMELTILDTSNRVPSMMDCCIQVHLQRWPIFVLMETIKGSEYT